MTSPDLGSDLSPVQRMHADCVATRNALGRQLEQAATRAVRPAPSIHYADYPREVTKRGIRIDEAAQRIANALSLHLD